MSEEVLLRLIRTYMETPQPVYAMIWQGGEPTLMGSPFFEKVVAYQKRFGRQGARIANSLQTNAVRITDDLAAHLGRYRFLTGCSIDGPPGVHDRHRKTASGKPTHARVMEGVRTLRANRVRVNALALVSRAGVEKPLEVYRHLKDQGFAYIQFVPCVELDDAGSPLPFSVDGESWGRFMRAVFDEWHARDQARISVRLFDSVLYRLVTGKAGECRLAPRCDGYFVVEHNGDIYPCDFFVEPRWKIGNIMEMSWQEARSSETYRRFAALKGQWSEACASCEHLPLCMGDCLKYRMAQGGEPRTPSSLCSGWKAFYDATMDRFRSLAARIPRTSF